MHLKTIVIITLVGLTAVIAGIATYTLVQHNAPQNTANNSSDIVATSETYKKYNALEGEAYDKAFLANMIVHHESAMNMAEMANGAAGRNEIRSLALDISTIQGKEVSDMNSLQKQWGYPITSGHNMTDSENTRSSMKEMTAMQDKLTGLKGNAFDEKFLELMIAHHQEAIDMSEPADTRAQHQEVKALAKSIVDAQTNEIEQMQIWQRNWGFKITNSNASSSGMSH